MKQKEYHIRNILEVKMAEYNKKDDSLTVINNNYLPKISPEAFKAWFYLYVGRPDCTLKILGDRKKISAHSLKELNKKIIEKLNLHTLEANISSVNIKFSNGEMIDYNLWESFLEADYHKTVRTEQLEMKWDFLLRIKSDDMPQRHTLTVKLSNGLTPRDLFRLATIAWESDAEFDVQAAVCVIRVDFISNLLADELVHIVDSWYKCLPDPNSYKSYFRKIRKYDQPIAIVIHYSLPVFFWCALLVYAKNLIPFTKVPVNQEYFAYGLFLILSCIIGTFILDKIGFQLARSCFSAMNTPFRFSIFELTDGDKNYAHKCIRINNRSLYRFIINAAIAIILNIISSIIVALYY